MAREHFDAGCRRLWCAALAIMVWVAGWCQSDSIVDESAFAGPRRVYVSAEQLPNAVHYLPAPPDTMSAQFSSDFQHWLWGKSQRGTARGTQASNESQYGLNRLALIMGPVIGVSMSSARTPKLIRLIYHVGETGSKSTQYAKMTFMRKRPFMQMGEHTWGRYDDEAELSTPTNSSYPSAHSAFGWAVGLVLAEMLPQLQDTILSRAYQYGQSRVIVGAHWQSDVEAARLTASAAVASMHNTTEFHTDLQAAREEYYSLRGTTPPDEGTIGLPRGLRFLEAAVDSMSPYYLSDVQQYWQGITERASDRALQVPGDVDTSLEAVLVNFGEVLETQIDEVTTPALHDVVRVARQALVEAAGQLQADAKFRRQPFAQVGNQPMAGVAADAAATSYPSVSATVAWGVALVLAELVPDLQEQLLQRGFEMGRSAVIAGTGYASDVQAGRTLACAVVARLHARSDFVAMMNNARFERYEEHIYTPIDDVLTRSAADPEGWYTVGGLRHAGEPAESGIYIHDGRKVVK